MVEDSATLPSSKYRDLNTPLTTLLPLMVEYAFPRRRIGPGFIARREYVLGSRRGPGSLRAVLSPSPKLAHVEGNSIIADLPADDAIR
jgi:hypothetical protein